MNKTISDNASNSVVLEFKTILKIRIYILDNIKPASYSRIPSSKRYFFIRI